MTDAVYSDDYRFYSPTKARLADEHRERRDRLASRRVSDSGINLRAGRAAGISGWQAAVARREAREKRAENAQNKIAVEKPVTKLAFDPDGNVERDWIDVSTKHRLSEVLGEVSRQFGLSVAEVCSQRRTTNLIAPRHIAMALCKHLTGRSLPEIGRKIGMRDHTTVLHACRKYQPVIDMLAVELPVQTPIGVWVAAVKKQIEITKPLKWQSTGQALEQA